MPRAALAAFLTEQAGLREGAPGALARALCAKYVLLPTADDKPLPSVALAPYVEEETPLTYELAPWQVWCYPAPDVITTLNDLQFRALTAPDDFQLGPDLLFWQRHAQALRAIIARDQYIPALTYRALAPAGGKRTRQSPAFEILPGWEFVSAAYDAAIRAHAAAMPVVCRAGAHGPDGAALFDAEPLLRHFSECLLHDIVAGTPFTAKFDQQIAGTLLAGCVATASPPKTPLGAGAPPRPPAEALADYRHWLGWRARLAEAPADTGFTLCFRLEDAAPDAPDAWRLHFLVAGRRDPSYKVSLAEYWPLDAAARAIAARPFGADFEADFEKELLLAPGAAARIYPTIWDGLATDRPTGCRLALDAAFAFLKESAWVLEDAGFTVIVPAWWTPEGRRRARIRLKTAATTTSGTAAGGPSRAGFDTLIAYQYQLSIAGQAVTEEEWRQLVDAKTPLVQFRGQWMELDRDKMQELLEFWRAGPRRPR